MPHQLPFKEKLKKDLPSSVMVFLVALPLCLGIALASGTPAFSGILAGIIGGIVVGSISGAQLSVSGPAAGLTVIVVDSIRQLGSFDAFLLAVCISGVLQIVLGILKAGVMANFFPSSVIKGMLASIGLVLILKQLPKALGYDFDFEGDESFEEAGGHNTFTDIYYAFLNLRPGALIISISSLITMLAWDSLVAKLGGFIRFIPGALMAVLMGILINEAFGFWSHELFLEASHRVDLPTGIIHSGITDLIIFPDFTFWNNPKIYSVAITLAIVASIESLLSIEAGDQIDPHHRITPLNRELIAQGIGNICSGFIGGLPVTAVIVRTSANVLAGAISKFSTIFHGTLLVLSIVIFPQLLNKIPLSSLAAILLIVGFKLTKPSLFVQIYKKGLTQFIPFVITILAIIFTNLLVGIGIGLASGLSFVLRSNFRRSISITIDKNNVLIRLRHNVSFLNKTLLRETLMNVKDGSSILIDGTSAVFIDQDIIETIETFAEASKEKKITVEIKRTKTSQNDYFRLID